MSVEYANGKNQHKLHNLQCLEKNMQILKKNVILQTTHKWSLKISILDLHLNFNRIALNCYFIDK